MRAVPDTVPFDDALVTVAVGDGAGSAEQAASRGTRTTVASSDQRVMLMGRILLCNRSGRQSAIAGS
jgi:hypothetical protein